MSERAPTSVRASSRLRQSDDTLLVTLLAPAYAARLALALPCGVCVHRLECATQLIAAQALLPHAVVVDPLMCDDPLVLSDALRAIAARATLIAYTAVSPPAMRRLVDIPSLAGVRLVLFGVDDGPAALRDIVTDVRARARHHRVLDTLRACAGPMPPEIDAALHEVLARASALPPTVSGLARAAHVSVRTLQRRLREERGPSPHWLIRAARALLARELLCGSPLTVEEIACHVGYAKLHSFRALIRWSFASSPSDVRYGRSSAMGPRWNAAPVRRRDAISSHAVAEMAC
jgi:AraC-like DNA-binding protein